MARKKLPTVKPAKPPAATAPTYVRSDKHEENPKQPPLRKPDKRGHLVRYKANGVVLGRVNLWIPIDVANELDKVSEEDGRAKAAIVSDGLEMFFAYRLKRLPPSRKR